MINNSLFYKDFAGYVGDPSQLFGIKDCYLNGGRATGVRAVEIRNGSGLEFTVLPDRGMDISQLSFKGINFSYLSKTGIVSPVFYEPDGTGFLRNFYAGFLTTCGLTNVGVANQDDGEDLGLHGRISNTPAEQVCASVEVVRDNPEISVKGQMRQAKVFGENLLLKREISTWFSINKIKIIDTVMNLGYSLEPLMLLYHFNIGYPLLSEKAYLISTAKKITPRNDDAAKGLKDYNAFTAPVNGYKENVFFHEIAAAKDGTAFGAIYNKKFELGIAIWFNTSELPRLTQWKQMQAGEYANGIEPSNCNVEGRASARKEGSLQFIRPGEIRTFHIEIEVIDGAARMNELEELSRKLV